MKHYMDQKYYMDKVDNTYPELDDFFDLEDAIKCLKKIRLNSAEWSEEERAKHLFYRDEVLDLMEHQIKTHKEIDEEQEAHEQAVIDNQNERR